jgi:putative PEP-CTERM system histidine kinase
MAGHAITALVAAILFLALGLATVVRRSGRSAIALVTAFALSATWLFAIAAQGAGSAEALAMEPVRNLGWLWFMASIAGSRGGGQRISAVGWIYIGLFAIQCMIATMVIVATAFRHPLAGLEETITSLQMLCAAGALVLVHNLFEAGRADERKALTLPLGALAGMWAYDLNLHAIAYLSGAPADLMLILRPAAMLAVALLFGIDALRPSGHAVRLSRPVAFRSLALAAVSGWLALLALLAALMSGFGGDFGERAQVGVLASAIVAIVLAFASPRIRAQLRVWTVKHFFEHRYDYRSEWLRFTATLNRPEDSGLSLDARVIKALADIVESSGGRLVARDPAGDYTVVAQWPADGDARAHGADWADLAHWLTGGRIIQLDEVRNGAAPAEEIAAVPSHLVADERAWIVIPLIHLDAVEGIALLDRPILNRALDWEDFDLLKVAGRQVASHLAEARGTEALAESARFDEFHRRFAFMMHDVKNLASQMALLARNAERHGDNPAFRTDMVATLKLSADRLGQLMQRLSQQQMTRAVRCAPVDLGAVARSIASARRSQHAVLVEGEATALAWADAETVEQLLVHLVQNAIDATEGDAPVRLRLGGDTGHVTLAVEDRGAGMSAAFIRSQLFRPFSSTKDGGFGIGAFQARRLAEAMGGTLAVASREGEGSIFTLTLARADSVVRDTPVEDSEAA